MRRSFFAPLTGGALVAVLALTACNKTYSTDEPFVDNPTPSLYIGSGNQFLYALSPSTGTRKWEFNTESPIIGTPYQDKTNLYVATQAGGVFKLDPNSGKLRLDYRKSLKGRTPLAGSIVTSLLGDENFLYFGTIGSEDPTKSYLYALDVKGDSVKWRYETSAGIESSPTIFRNKIYFGSDNGSFYCLNKDGTLAWAAPYSPGTGGSFYASAVASGNAVYAPSTDGRLYAINANDGTLLWTYPGTGSPAITGGIYSSPVAIGGRVIFGANDGQLHCIDSGSHNFVWKAPTGERIFGSPFVYNQVVYVGSYDNMFYAFDIINGKKKWSIQGSKVFRSSPLVANGVIYVGGFDQQLYALDTANGRVRWQFDVNGTIQTSPVLDDKTGLIQYPTISGASRF